MLTMGKLKSVVDIFLVVSFIYCLSSFHVTLAEKEPIDEDAVLKTDKTILKGHTFDNIEVSTNGDEGGITNLGFIHAFVASISVIIVSELGDKTFFIAAIMAMRHPRLTVFLGAIAALALMTVLSVVFGYAATIIPRAYTYYISTALFFLFGLKMLKEGYSMSATEGQEELEEVQQDLRKREDEHNASKRRDVQCAAIGCSNRMGDGLCTTRFPRNPDSLAQWLSQVNRPDWEPTKTSFLCEAHFDSDQWKKPIICGKPKLKSNAVPTLFKEHALNPECTPMIESTQDENENENVNTKTLDTDQIDNAIAEDGDKKNDETNKEVSETLPDSLTPNNITYEREAASTVVQDAETGVIRKAGKAGSSVIGMISRIFIQSFTLTFLAEWGDRSQLTTIILAAREDVVGVTVGGVLGHALCTGLAVMGGRMIAQRISVRTVTLIGGVVFILFAITALFFDPNAE